ncbi:hypothetical protein A3D05_04675 [Candidatus Gottesmanbacteria bacterium RIFCSPHIGHO2_02_FULL_40_24]|nr:MAG: hypothetical protein A3D05_04675 [Candidatus Gottesmanbacteria bacterium RIFCSPHIGHO2_02_FULL_40_24]OGG25835.1 MAG: hypothetical protein A3E42_05945 [Candidatus Gottesmanbacteria bacterium RIFCSPHIGHO2_12_FULL_40_13]OGG33255.1 MAG: hypothetical protein A3I80_02325 [Candidatus Gottesmanbacteria bacterium RIFCSPLOWO2_02_FULL_40_10]
MDLLIGIPAFNEETMIGKVLKSLPKRIPGIDRIDILVVDDGSSDRTAAVAKNSGALVLRHIINRGLGGALKTIFAYAGKYRYDLLVTIDADGQHHPADIVKILRPVIDNGKDVVIGTRWKNSLKKKFILRYLINQLANFYTFLLYGIETGDSQSGFRSFSGKAVKKINLSSDGMEVSSEFFREIYRHDLIYDEVPVKLIYTDYSQGKGQRLSNAPNVFFRQFLRLLR